MHHFSIQEDILKVRNLHELYHLTDEHGFKCMSYLNIWECISQSLLKSE